MVYEHISSPFFEHCYPRLLSNPALAGTLTMFYCLDIYVGDCRLSY